MRGLDPDLVYAVLNDWRSAPVDDRLKSALGFLEKVTLSPEKLTRDDATVLREAGVSVAGARELLYVCFLFNVLDRLADTLDFDLPSQKGAGRIGFLAFKLGYGIAKLPG